MSGAALTPSRLATPLAASDPAYPFQGEYDRMIKRLAARPREVIQRALPMRSSRPEAGSASDKRTAGRQRACDPTAVFGQPLGAPHRAQVAPAIAQPETLRRYFNAHAATPYLCFRSRANGASPELTWASHPRRPRVRTPEAGSYPARVPQALSPPLAYACTSGAASQVPNDRRSAARVLMDEGWSKFTAASSAGDKVQLQSSWPGLSRPSTF
jgi:hypothetical protein